MKVADFFFSFGTNLSFGPLQVRFGIDLFLTFHFRLRGSFFFRIDRKEAVKATLLLAIEELLELVGTFSHTFIAMQ